LGRVPGGLLIENRRIEVIPMAGKNAFFRWAVTRVVAHSLTGKSADLQRLIRIVRRIPTTVAVRRFFDALDSSVSGRDSLGDLFLRVGRRLSPASRRGISGNLLYNEFIAGYKIRRAHSIAGNWVPSFFVMSPTMRCTLSCRGCYSGIYRKEETLSFGEMDRVLGEARELGIFFVVISGGEPYLLADQLLRLFKKHRDMYFLTYTNGTLLDETICRQLARLGNVALAVSVEGFERETEERRGPAVFSKILKSMELMRREGLLFGFSATATRENVDAITSREFVEFYLDKGCLFGWYFLFLPVGADPVIELAPSPEQRVEMGSRISRLRHEYPIFLGDFWNDGPAVGGCMAGGRNYLHILNNGNVEPCVFCHFSSDNIKGKTLLEVANSPFFKAIRREFPYNPTGNLLRPCMIIDNPQVLRKLVEQYAIPAGHDKADAIVREPQVVSWADAYAARMAELTEPLWEAMVNDPGSRWYREGPEYRDYLRPPVCFEGERPTDDASQPMVLSDRGGPVSDDGDHVLPRSAGSIPRGCSAQRR
jgi:MoaA/NifB/PqqE/SkfB family radical SAM enzyme